MADALNKYAPIQSGIMVTIHAYTGDQMTLDGPQRKGDLRRSRAAKEYVFRGDSTQAIRLLDMGLEKLHLKIPPSYMICVYFCLLI